MIDLRKLTTLGLTLAIGLFLAGAALAAPAQSAEPESADLSTTNSTTRADVADAVEAEAAARGVVADSAGALFATRDDVYVINSFLEDGKGVTRADLARGADLGLVYLNLPEGSQVPSGWYTVRVTAAEDSSEGTAELIDANGNVAGTFSAEVGSQAALIAGRVTVDAGLFYVCVDYHWGFIYVKLCVGIEIF